MPVHYMRYIHCRDLMPVLAPPRCRKPLGMGMLDVFGVEGRENLHRIHHHCIILFLWSPAITAANAR